jgi:hypothetical protein
VGCFGLSRLCTHAYYFLLEYIHGFSLDNLHTHRFIPFKRACPLKNKKKCIKEKLNYKGDTFVLTWYKKKFILSNEAPGIKFFSKGYFSPFG